MIVHAAIAIAALYYGALAFIFQNAVFIFATLGSGALAGIVILSRNVFALIHDIETHVIGIKVSQEQVSELWQKVRYVANQLGTLSPDQIVLGLELRFFVTETDVLCLDGKLSGRTLYCSLPLCRLLNNDELSAIIGHELAHFKGLDTKFSKKFLPIYLGTSFAIISLEKTVNEGLSKTGLFPAIAILSYFFECFSVAKNRISRIRELEADKQGALVSSKASMAESLVKIHAFAGAWHLIEKAAVENLQKGKAAINLSKTFAEAMPKQVDENLLDKIFEAHLDHPTDSQPPLSERLKSLQFKIEDMAENGFKIDSTKAAINLLANAENLEETVSAAYQSNLNDMLSINYGADETEHHIESKKDVLNNLKCNDCGLVVNERDLDSDQLLCPECRGRLEYI
jgi:Zn-dependent protease with chaperone function